MGFLSVIRRWALRDKLPIREIARRTGLSRNTIRKYLREGVVEPKFKAPPRPSKLDPYADRLSAWLLAQTRKSRKERRTVKQMHADLVKLGYDGSYGRVAAFARAWRADRHRAEQTTGRGTYVPLVFQPGEAFQFDWSEDWANIAGERIKLQVAHIKLSHSRAFLVRAYPLQTHEMLFDAHWHAFRVFGGVPGRGIYDNMKTAVDRVGKGKQRDVNARFKSMASHYVFVPSPIGLEPMAPQWATLQPGSRMGERPGREERPGCAQPPVAGHASLRRSERAEPMAGRSLYRSLGGDSASGIARFRR